MQYSDRSKELNEQHIRKEYAIRTALKSEISFRPEQTKYTILGEEEGISQGHVVNPERKYANYEPCEDFYSRKWRGSLVRICCQYKQ